MKINIQRKLLLSLNGLFLFLGLSAQELDSLSAIYNEKRYTAAQELTLLRELSREHTDPEKKLRYSVLLEERAMVLDSQYYLWDAYMQEGTAHRLKSDLPQALSTFFEASRIAQEMDSTRLVALSNVTIGDVYSVLGDHSNSVEYYNNGIEQLRALNRESVDLATALLNAGDEYFNAESYDSAMNLFYESSMIFKRLNYQIGSAYNLGNIGMVYAKQGKVQLAEANINEAIQILEASEDYYAISIYLDYLADIYLEQGKYDLAISYAKRSLDLATKYQLKDEISKANQELFLIYQHLNQYDKALYHYQEHIRYRDSVNNLSQVQEMANLRTDFELSKKEIELGLLNEQKENQSTIAKVIAVLLLLVSILTIGLFRRNKSIARTRKTLEAERKKSNELLRNILPEETADELKEKGHVKAKKYNNVTVLFSDFKGFTKYAEALPPEDLVKTIDLYFSEFDKIMDRFGIEKIKTIGDSYMCASGIPVPDEKHATNMILAAKAMIKHVEAMKSVHRVDEARFDIRIGIHTGPVVAGVVGERKFAYDIWGDTVNIASRVEVACAPGKINVSKSTYDLVKDQFDFIPRGEIEVKNRSKIEMYYLKL